MCLGLILFLMGAQINICIQTCKDDKTVVLNDEHFNAGGECLFNKEYIDSELSESLNKKIKLNIEFFSAVF